MERKPKILFTTNFPSPYRTSFFNELSKTVDLTVAYERERAAHRDSRWTSDETVRYREEFLKLKPVGTSQSRGLALAKYARAGAFDFVVFGGYASPAVICAILSCQLRGARYGIEFDGSFNKKDRFFRAALKRRLLKKAEALFITCRETEEYLLQLGVRREQLVRYPFTSLKEADILPACPTAEEKAALKAELGISEQTALISVGRFIPSKGHDTLIEAMGELSPELGLYIVGGTPDEKYRELARRFGAENIHFVDFMPKQELFRWLKACDLFVFATRTDVWGLVINEAFACGLPAVSTDRCNAALELLRDGRCGTLVPADDPKALAAAADRMLRGDLSVCGANCLEAISGYTIERMAECHARFLCGAGPKVGEARK